MFGLGGGASPAGAMTAAGAGGALTVDGVISSNLVAYKDVGELQTQNQRLLRALRQLGDDHERALSEKDEAADAQVAAALQEVDGLRQGAQRQRVAAEQLAQQRDMYKALADAAAAAPAPAPALRSPAAAAAAAARRSSWCSRCKRRRRRLPSSPRS